MTKIHSHWLITGDEEQSLFIWAERWRSVDHPLATEQCLQVHPFSLGSPEVESLLRDRGCLDETIEFRPNRTQLFLPTANKELPLLAEQMGTAPLNELSLQPWQVTGVSIPGEFLPQFLKRFPAGDHTFSPEFNFWTQIYRWSLDLLVRGKFLPVIDEDEGALFALWQPLLDSTKDQTRLARFNNQLPLSLAIDGIKPQTIILSFLTALIDTQLRQLDLPVNPAQKESLPQAWSKTLIDDDLEIAIEVEEVEKKRFIHALDTWHLPVQDYIVDPVAYEIKEHNFRTCFVLVPPTQGEINWGHTLWKLRYHLQAMDDPEVLIPAETVWQFTAEELSIDDRLLEQPQETLLKGLGLAARIYSPIAENLQAKNPLECILEPIQVYEFLRAIVDQLSNIGLGVILPPGLDQESTENRLGIQIKASVVQRKGIRLNLQTELKYKLNLAIADQVISPDEFKELLEQKSPIVQIRDRWIALQPADVRAAQAIVEETHEDLNLTVEDGIRLSTGEVKTLAKLPVISFDATGVLKELIATFINRDNITLQPTPTEFQGQLRPYQIKGFSWLAFLEKWGLGSCLADDMGLGKTIQTIAFLLHLKEQELLTRPVLLVCPTSVLSNWYREVHKFGPTIKAIVHHGEKRIKGKTSLAKKLKDYQLVITSYNLIYRDLDNLKPIKWRGIVLDEAQNIKNSQAKQARGVRELSADFRIALTGTPVENNLLDLWSILDFLNPGFLGEKGFFQRRFALPIQKYGDQDSLRTLRSLVQPLILRRLKTDKTIIQDLPEKQESNVFCGLSAEQAELYEQLVNESLEKIEASKGIERHGLILTLLVKLKQLCNHPALFLKEKILEQADRSGKLLRLEEMLDVLITEGDRALIFTQFAEWGKLLQPYLEQKLNDEVLFLSGSTRPHQRQALIDRFQNDPEGPSVFILSLKAGGTGLNLTRANHVFHIDRWWNPAVENQATDRAFRIGQKQNVQVHKFICSGTLEDKINDILESKKQLAEQTISAGELWITDLDTQQLRNLLALDRDEIM